MTRAAAVAMALALLGPMSARAQQPGGAPAEPPRTITVSGTGTLHRTPDQAVVSLAVENQAPTARQAAQQNAEQMDRVVSALRQAGIAAARIRTQGYNLMPEYQYIQPSGPGQPGEQKLIGYRASNMVEVTVDAIPRVGAVIDAAIAAGANRAQGISFQLADPEGARREALRLAVANARLNAEALAQAAGQRLGSVLRLSMNVGVMQPPRPMLRAMSADASVAPTPVEPGEMDVTADVTAVYRLGADER